MNETIYKIEASGLKRFVAESKNTYNSLLELIRRQSKRHSVELSDLVDNYSSLFAGIVKGVGKISTHDPVITGSKDSDNLLIAYSMAIASKTITKDLESMLGEGSMQMNVDDTVEIEPDKTYEWGKTTYSNTKIALESMAKYGIESSKKPIEALKDFFDIYTQIITNHIASKMEPKSYEALRSIKWEIGSYKIDGLDKLNQTTQKKQSENNLILPKNQENDRFHTPLQQLIIPENEIIPKERIVGDHSIIDHLERMVAILFCYNINVGMNPYIDDEDMFTSTIILEGMPGGGKGVVCYHTIDYALKLNEAIKSDLLITEFVVDSSWVDGSILKLKSQFKQIMDDNRKYIIFQDEIQRLIKSSSKGIESSHNEDVVLELQKFINGTYRNKGNYLLLATTNKFNSLPLAIRDRAHLHSWKGAQTPEEKATLYRFKLEKGIQRGYVQVSDSELRQLGKLAYEAELSGRTITRICKTAKQNNYNYDGIGKVLRLNNGSYDDQVKEKNKLFGKITFDVLEAETLRAIDNIRAGKENTIRYGAD
jgi:hypothetical protein